ncbi:MAG: hypothetical protein IH583_12970, partial [Candidatus Aminicenantes bacterium]|nr:hypothetical protein [Candidatus Aminicenantes bacterium]
MIRNAVPKPRARAFIVLAIAVALTLSLAQASPLAAQAPDRYLDGAPDRDGSVRLVIFNPETFNVRALATLRK